MIMILRRRADPIDQLLDRTRQLYDELRAAAVEARRAAGRHKIAADDQHEAAAALSPPGDDDARKTH